MKGLCKIFIGSVWAGVAISIGAIAYLCTKQAIFFSIGLLIVCSFRLNLFTGKIPYADIRDFPKLLLIFFGNVIGAFLIGYVFSYVKQPLIIDTVKICRLKLAETWEIIPLAILCNVLIFIAVDVFKNEKFSQTFRLIVLWLATATFVICGFEHCVANAFYFAFAGMVNFNSIIFLLSNMIWNAVGGLLVYHSFALINKEERS